MIRIFSAFGLLVAIAMPLAAQGVLIAPTSIFVDNRARTASVLLANPNDKPVEIELSTTYGYTVTDSAGRFSLWTTETPDSTAQSAAGWIRIFPRRVSIEPRAQQLVRLLISPPSGTPDGEYWARLVVMARGVEIPVTSPSDSGGVTVGLSVEVRTVLPILFRKGTPGTGTSLGAVTAVQDHDSLVVRARIARGSNAAVLGTLRAALLDSAGTVRDTLSLPLAVYEPIAPRLAFPVDSLPGGSYSVRLEVIPARIDLPPESILRFPVARDSARVTLD